MRTKTVGKVHSGSMQTSQPARADRTTTSRWPPAQVGETCRFPPPPHGSGRSNSATFRSTPG
eukprot:976945-Heterocapsa_arctica.AAC.1